MARIDICDICNSREDITTKRFVIGSQIDAAGGPSEDDFESFDLCAKCELELLREFVYSNAKSRDARIAYGVPLLERVKRKIEITKDGGRKIAK